MPDSVFINKLSGGYRKETMYRLYEFAVFFVVVHKTQHANCENTTSVHTHNIYILNMTI